MTSQGWKALALVPVIGALALVPTSATASSAKVELKGCSLAEPINALGPIAPNGTWKQDGAAIVATGTAAPWTVQTGGDSAWADYRLSAKVTIRKATPKPDFKMHPAEFDRYLPREMFPPQCQHTGQYRYRFFAGEFDWGSDAAVYVRYAGRWDCYRVQLSTRYQEIILWHGVGGYLQVVPCKLKVGQTYKLDVVAVGAHIRVLLDGEERINYWHRTLPTLAGGVGLGAYHATVAFQDVEVVELAAPDAGMPPHKPRFRTRTWRDLRWIFDGHEPMLCMYKDNPPIKGGGTKAFFYSLQKLMPGYRPYLHGWLGLAPSAPGKVITQLVGEVKDVRTDGENTDTLVLTFDTMHPAGLLQTHHTDRVTFDAVRGTYRHEVTGKVDFLKEVKTHTLEIYDPLTYNNKFPGRGVKYPWLPSGHTWGVVSGEEGKLFRHPLSQSLNLQGQNGFRSAPDKGSWMLYPDRAACPIFIYESPGNGNRFYSEVCHWGFDFHQRIRWPKPNQYRTFKAGDKLTFRHVIAAYPPREAERLFLASTLHPNMQVAKQYVGKRYESHGAPNILAMPVCDPGGTDFTRLYSVREPYVGWHFWGRYTVDDTVGHGDRYSLRLDGPAKTVGHIYHHMLDGYGKKYLCTVWLKTKGATGTGPVVTLKYAYAKDPADVVVTNLTGDNDWQKISFVTTVPVITFESYDTSEVILELAGEGQVWMDDFSVRPIADGETVTDTLPPKAKLTRAPAKSRKFW